MANTGTWVWDRVNMMLVPKSEYLSRMAAVARSTAVPLPQIARTSLDHVWNPVNGQRYTCSRNYERDVKAAGCEIVGNDAPTTKTVAEPPSAKADIARAWDQLTG